MNNLAEEQEFKEETVAEAIESAKQTTDQDDGDDGFEIEVVDDTPEEDQGKPRRAENAEPQVPSDDEVEKYSEGVQKRIKQLKFEYHEERRAKEEAARLQEEALKYAEQIKNENEKLRKTLDEGEGVLVNQAKGRVAAEIDKAKIAYKAAYESGDPDALVDAQEKLSALQAEKLKYESFKPQSRQQQTPQPQPQYQQPTPQPPKPDERALEWAAKNDWFEKDKEGVAGALLPPPPPPPQEARVSAARLANTREDFPLSCITCLDFLLFLRSSRRAFFSFSDLFNSN